MASNVSRILLSLLVVWCTHAVRIGRSGADTAATLEDRKPQVKRGVSRNVINAVNKAHTNPSVRWTNMPLGCDTSYNLGLCEVTLLQNACTAKFGKLKGIRPEDACERLWPQEEISVGSGLSPFGLYCRAAAADRTLLKKAQELSKYVPVFADHSKEPASWCEVKSMEHLSLNPESHKYKTPLERLAHAANPELLYHTGIRSWPNKNQAGLELTSQVRDFCQAHVTSEMFVLISPLKGISTIPNTNELPNEYGFCHKPWADQQDCAFYRGLREEWKNSYGKKYCNQIYGAAKLRCLALRKQVIRIAQDKAYFVNTAKGSDFDEIFRLRQHHYQFCLP